MDQLSEHNRKRLEERIASGQFSSADEFVGAALDWLEVVETPDDEDMKNIEEGLAELDRGEGRPADEVFKELRARYGLMG